jgi:hypothetical protein
MTNSHQHLFLRPRRGQPQARAQEAASATDTHQRLLGAARGVVPGTQLQGQQAMEGAGRGGGGGERRRPPTQTLRKWVGAQVARCPAHGRFGKEEGPLLGRGHPKPTRRVPTGPTTTTTTTTTSRSRSWDWGGADPRG